jgi:hypothetical protein
VSSPGLRWSRVPTGALGVVAGIVAGVIVVACARPLNPTPEWQRAQAKRGEITALWTQIRDWRREAHMGVEPSPQLIFQMRGQPLSSSVRACPDAHQVPPTCGDVCDLGESICDNAERICTIAAELGNDDFSADKCNSAKASCNEAKQRCCTCAGHE